MRAYVIRRVLLLIPTFFLLTILVFLSVRFIPGDVIDVLLGRMVMEAGGGPGIDRATLERRLGLGRAGTRAVRALDGGHRAARRSGHTAAAARTGR